jgi:hypothetical protein
LPGRTCRASAAARAVVNLARRAGGADGRAGPVSEAARARADGDGRGRGRVPARRGEC